MTIMKDVAIAKSEFQSGERAVTKIQDFQVMLKELDELYGTCQIFFIFISLIPC